MAVLPSVCLQVILASKGSRAPGTREAAGVEVLLHVAPEVGYVLDGCSTQLAGQALHQMARNNSLLIMLSLKPYYTTCFILDNTSIVLKSG